MSDKKYRQYSNTLLLLWMDNILTDGEYNKIMDKLNDRYLKEKQEMSVQIRGEQNG